MGEVLKRKKRDPSRRLWVLAALPLCLLAIACASSAPPPAVTEAAADPTEAAATRAPEPEAPPPVEIGSIDVVERAPDTAVVIQADGPLVWTGFRDAEGRLVVELPNSRPAGSLGTQLAGGGIVTGVDVAQEIRADRPVTLLVIDTSADVEHSIQGEGQRLEVVLMPLASAVAAELSYEPLPDEPLEEEPVTAAAAPAVAEPAPAPVAAARAEVGTPEQPIVAPPPSGVPATRLDGVDVLSTARGTSVRIAGDGEFSYSTFALDDPYRFVVDLEGVINESTRSMLDVGGLDVQRVRVAQFKPYPEAVSRVVFDLSERTVPQIERTANGLLVRFGEAAEAVAESAAIGGAGAENDTQSVAQGGSEAAVPETDYTAEETAAYEESYERAYEEPAPPPAYDDYATGGIEEQAQVAELAQDAQYAQAAEQEPSPPLEAPEERPLGASSTSDLEMFRSAQVQIQEPSSRAAGSQSFTAQTVGGTERQYVGEPISFSLRDADLVETLRAFAVLSGLNIVIQPGVSGTVTVELEDVPWDQAFEQILKINGLGYELDGNVMRIAPTNLLQQEAQQRQQLEQARALSVPLLTVIKRLSYANASGVASLLRSRGGVLSQRGSVIVDGRTNTLILKELPSIMDTVIAVIENLDIAEPQVMIEARIVETRKSFTRTLGVNWSFSGSASPATGNPTGLVFPATVDGAGGVNLLTGGDNAFLNLALGNLSGSFNLDIALQAAENEGLVNVLSAPKVATLNNERAEIQSGFQIPIQTVSNNTVSVQFVNATLRLQVTPQVTAEGTILMDIQIQKRNPEFALQVQGANAAPISTQEARTRVIVRDGGTTVIGGIYEVSTNEGQDRVPGLSNVPIIGHLFKNRRREDQNNELLIFITPRVMRL